MSKEENGAAAPSKKKEKKNDSRQAQFRLGGYFFSVLVTFGVLSFGFNNHFIPDKEYHELNSLHALEKFLQDSVERLELGPSIPQQDIPQSALAGLNCDEFGGPDEETAREMVYWQDIPEDSLVQSPFKHPTKKQYLTFEPDPGGWNNIRMGLETVIGLAYAMGRTLVLPPEQRMYLLTTGKSHVGMKQRKTFTFANFFKTQDISREHKGLEIISMEEFLQREALTGNLKNKDGSGAAYPPENRTNWDGNLRQVNQWLEREVATDIHWEDDACIVTFPATTRSEDMQAFVKMNQTLQENRPSWEDYVGKPVPVNASTFERLSEHLAGRKNLCLYDETLQSKQVIHLKQRLLVHFYAFLFFQDWNMDLWFKRFVRDHIRYTDEIQCAAARVVAAVRKHARQRDPKGNPQGLFDAMHVRRGDFQYKNTRIEAKQIFKNSVAKLTPNTTLYIATDERDKSFFAIFAKHYDVVFLDDFHEALGEETNSNFFGMIDALIASRSRVFFGCWFSTFTGYINRLRGYHSDSKGGPGTSDGIIPDTWYYVHGDKLDHMQVYYPVKQSFWAREFPTGWRLLNRGMKEFHKKSIQQR